MALSKQEIQNMIVRIAKEEGLDPNLALAVARQESGFNPSAKSLAGAAGLFQIMPMNWKNLGISSNPYNPEMNTKAGIRMLKSLVKNYDGDLELALAAYNAGSGNVAKYKGIPPFKETQNYVRSILRNYAGDSKNQRSLSKDKPILRGTINKTGGEDMTTNSQGNTNVNYTYNPTGMSTQDLYAQSVQLPSELRKYKTAYDLGFISKRDFANAIGVPAESIYDIQGLSDTEQQVLNKQVALDPNLITANQAAMADRMLEAQRQANQGVNIYDLLAQKNKEYQDYIQNDPRLNLQTRLAIDPDRAKLGQDSIDSYNLYRANLGLSPVNIPSYAQNQMRQYEIQRANEVGMPYAEYSALMDEQRKQMIEAKKMEVSNNIEALKAVGMSDQQIMKSLQSLGEKGIDALLDANKNAIDYYKTVGGNYINQSGGAKQELIKGNADINKQILLNNAAALQNQISADTAIDEVLLKNAIEKERITAENQREQLKADVDMRGQDTDYNKVLLQQPAKNLAAFGQFAANTSPAFGYTAPQQYGMFSTLNPNVTSTFISPNATTQDMQNAFMGGSLENMRQNNPATPKSVNIFDKASRATLMQNLFGGGLF